MKRNFSVVVVGSGFGGSVMAYRLALAGISVCLLERGRAYPPGSFPRSPLGFKDNFWDPGAGLYGLFDVWSFKHVEALVASGLGGGSLIYSNVMLRKDKSWFYYEAADGSRRPWPITYDQLEPHYSAVEDVLKPRPYPFDSPKTVAFEEAARKLDLEPFRPPLAIAFPDQPVGDPHAGVPIAETVPNVHGIGNRRTCRLCGECNVGCNDGSKNSLDYTYLSLAKHAGLMIEPDCEVRGLRKNNGAFTVLYRRYKRPANGRRAASNEYSSEEITAKYVVLAAGTLGSPYLLMTNRKELGLHNQLLGSRFCGNGDFFGLVAGASSEVNGKKVPKILNGSDGAVITAAARYSGASNGAANGQPRSLYVEEAGQPEWLAWLAEGMNVPRLSRSGLSFALQRAWRWLTNHADSNLSAEINLLLGDAEASASALPLCTMGLDTPDGKMGLSEPHEGRYYLTVDWKKTKGSRAHYALAREATARFAKAMGGRYSENKIASLFNRAITVHPLGGCPMADSAAEGVVSAVDGEVFGVPNLFVADGSVMPGPIGPNPSLTIAAVADHFADALIARVKANDAGSQRVA